nr:Myc-type, basic helix-loop-helix (bHLH) domain-containing protein [Tanacetum cinerariifolium]
MASLGFCSNWPTLSQLRHETVVPQPLENSPFHDNFNLFKPNNNHFPIQNSIKYPTLCALYNPVSHQHYSSPLSPNVLDHKEFFPMEQMQPEYYPNLLYVPNVFDNQEFSPMEQMQIQPEYCSYNSFDSYPLVPDVCEQMHPEHCLYNSYDSHPLLNVCEQMQPELLPLPEIYQYGSGSEDITAMSYDIGHGCNVVNLGESLQVVENGEGEGRKLSAQSMAARVRRRKISEKTMELGKMVPGGHRMTTAEMFQAAFKYIKFLQAQVAVLHHMGSSPVLGEELQALITNPTVQEKLYTAGKCVVTEQLGKMLADNHQGTKNNINN